MEIDVMNTILFTNLQLLGMDTIAMEGKYHVPFSKDMFNLPNKAGSEAVLHFLFDRLNPELFKEQFRDCWPVVDRKAEMQFRKVCNTWLSSIQADNPDAHMPRINASLLLSPGGRKFIHLLYKFSSYILTQVMTKEHGYNMRDAFEYPVLSHSAFGDVMKGSLENTCFQLHTNCFEQLHLTVAANRKWRESADELIKMYRRFSRSKRDLENEKRQLVSSLADSAQKQGLSLPAKRTVSMFDSGQDMYSKHRGKRMEKARTEWNQLQNFSEEMQDKRTILKSVLDPNPERPVVNGNGLGIRIPNLLLQEFQKDIQMQEIDNVFKGGCLNLESVALLWNMCLGRYREQLETEALPDVTNEIPAITTQVQQHHANLEIAQKTRGEVMNATIPTLKSEIDKLQQKLCSLRTVSRSHNESNNNPSLGLIAPTPPLAFTVKNSKTSDTPTAPAVVLQLKNDTPDAVSTVVGNIEQSIRHHSEQKGGLKSSSHGARLEALKKSTKAFSTGIVSPQTGTQKVSHRESGAIGNDKNQTGAVQVKPPTTGKSVPQRKAKSAKAPAMAHTPTKRKQNAQEVLVNSVVDSVLNADTSHKDSWSMELKSLGDLMLAESPGYLDQTAFVSRDLIPRSPQQGTPISSLEAHGTKNSSQRISANDPHQDIQSLKSLGNTPFWTQMSPSSSSDKRLSDQSPGLFSPVASTSVDSQTDSMVSAWNKSAHSWSASQAISPAQSPLSTAKDSSPLPSARDDGHLPSIRDTDLSPHSQLQVSDVLAIKPVPKQTDGLNRESFRSESRKDFLNKEDDFESESSLYKSMPRFPGDGQQSQEPEASPLSNSSEDDEDNDMRSMSKDSLFNPASIDKQASNPPTLLNNSTVRPGAALDHLSFITNFGNAEATLLDTDGKMISFQAAGEEHNEGKQMTWNLHNISSGDLLDLDSGDDLLPGLEDSFSPAKKGIVLQRRQSPSSISSKTEQKINSAVSGVLSESFTVDRPSVNASSSSMSTLASVNLALDKASGSRGHSAQDSMSKSGNDDLKVQLALLQKRFASIQND